jgi:hypothetical protein
MMINPLTVPPALFLHGIFDDLPKFDGGFTQSYMVANGDDGLGISGIAAQFLQKFFFKIG